MRKIYQYILMAVAMMATASCSNELDEALQSADNGNLQFVVGDFPAFGEGAATRAIGFPNVGKTGWAENDAIFVFLYSEEYGLQTVQINYQSGVWTPDSEVKLSYLKDETPTITALYAPSYSLDGTVKLKNNMKPGMDEYIETTDCTIVDGEIKINFKDAERSYSRLRLATMPEATLTVEFTGFTPAGASEATSTSYSLTADDDGNAYLYGTFAINGTVTATAKHEIYPEEGITTTIENKNFNSKPSTSGRSYVLGVKLGDYMDAKQALSGNVALKDGSFVSNAKIAEMTDVQKSAMAGIVFWTVVETDPTDRTYPASLTDDKVMNADFPHCTHGLIVSLTNTGTMAWQSSEEFIWEKFQSTSNEYSPDNSDYVSIYQLSTGDGNYYKILGYQNTRILEAYNDDCNAQNRTAYIVKPITQLSSYSDKNPAPFGSTGWYLPSIKELHMLCHKDVDDKSEIGTNCKTTLNNLLSELNMDILTDQTYWSSTENNNNAACVVNFVTGKNSYPRKMVPNYIIRYVCAF